MAEKTCGCTIKQEEPGSYFDYEILHCPLHAAALDLLAACEAAEQWTLDIMDCSHCAERGFCQPHLQEYVTGGIQRRAAIAKGRGRNG